jgi:hypothetical protein
VHDICVSPRQRLGEMGLRRDLLSATMADRRRASR